MYIFALRHFFVGSVKSVHWVDVRLYLTLRGTIILDSTFAIYLNY